jgi:hypothetical protein
MIKDAKGRKWSMRFKQYQQGWQWDARWKYHGQTSGMTLFKTKALAEEDARRTIQSGDAVAAAEEFFRRLRKRGSELARAGRTRQLNSSTNVRGAPKRPA